MKIVRVFVAVIFLGLAAVGTSAAAEEQKTPAPFGENVKMMLDASINRVVTLQLASGQEISGTVIKVGDHVVQLTRVVGRDFYDAMVVLDRVDAVLFKVAGR